jgi:phage regulator Rha-like protein
LAEYSIIITSDFGDFVEGVRLNEGESYYLELEGIAEYYFQEQKSGFELVVNVKSLNNE